MEYDIRHILDLLDLDGWQLDPALKFYFSPMMAAYNELVDELREMHRKGHLRVSYFVERNVAMTEKIFELVRQYQTVKVLAGDELKRDQLKFMYKVHEKIYNCALKDIYLNNQQHQMCMQNTVPELTVFTSMQLIMEIDDKKIADAQLKARKKAERAELGLSEEEEEPL